MSRQRLLMDTVIRLETDGNMVSAYWLMDKPERGWSSKGIRYPWLSMLLERWDITIGERGRDEHGEFLVAIANQGDEESEVASV